MAMMADPARAAPTDDFPDANAVLSRERPGLDPTGLRAGGFTLLPTLTASLLSDDNVFDTEGQTSKSAIYTFQPAIAVRSNWGLNHLNLDGSGLIQRYTNVSRANFEEARFSGDGLVQLASNLAVQATGHFNREAEPRGTSGDLFPGSDPIIYRQYGGSGNATASFSALQMSANVSIDRFTYNEAHADNGDIVPQAYRDHNSFYATGQVGVEAGPGILLFVSGSYNKERYDQSGANDLSSTGQSVLGGVDFKITRLVRGKIGIGYLHRKYENSSFGSISGLAYDGSLVWNVTTLLTLTATASKQIEESPFINVAGITANTGGLKVEWEILRKLLLAAHADFTREKYKDFDRLDRRLETGVGLRYLANRFMEFGLSYDRRDQWGKGLFGRTYHGNAVRFSITLQR
jgi:hypothetical protein